MEDNMNLLEELLRQTEETKKLVKENAEKILSKTTKEIIAESIQEEPEEADGGNDDFMVSDVDNDGNELPTEDAPESGEAGELPSGEEQGEMPEVEPLDAEGETETEEGEGEEAEEMEEETLDLTNASPEEVLDAIKNAKDDDKIVIVKKSVFDVDIESEPEMEIPDESETGDMEGEPVEEEMMTEEDGAENLQEKKILQKKNEQLKLYEGKIAKLQEAVKLLVVENEGLKEKEGKYRSAINEAKSSLAELALSNVKLLYTTRLFTENATSKAEKEEILKEFDEKAGTANECKLIYESWDRMLKVSKKSEKPLLPKDNLNEPRKIEAKKPVNESKSFEDKTKLDTFRRFAEHKI